MRFDLSRLYHGCPKELEKDFQNLYYPASRLVSFSDSMVAVADKEMFIKLNNAKDELMSILSRITSLLIQNYSVKTKFDLSVKLKFIEDIGEVHKSLTREDGNSLNIKVSKFPKYYNMTSQIISIFDFIIYQPITLANRKNIVTLQDYITEVFEIASSNCAILGHSIRSDNKATKTGSGILSKSSSTILGEFETTSDKTSKLKILDKEDKTLLDDSDDDDSDDDDDDDDDDSEEDVIEETKEEPIGAKKKRGRPKKC